MKSLGDTPYEIARTLKFLLKNAEPTPEDNELWYYLGSVFNILPSGKYYMPFAMGNVTDAEVSSDYDYADMLYLACDFLEKETGNTYAIESNPNDPTELFLVQVL